MTTMTASGQTLRVLLANRKGVAALEYGMIAALIAAIIAGAVTTLGSNLSGVFTTIVGSF